MKIENKIKTYLINYIKSEIRPEPNAYILAIDLLTELETYLLQNNIKITKNQLRMYVIPVFCECFNLTTYKSIIVNKQKVYFDFTWKSKNTSKILSYDNILIELNEIKLELNSLKLKYNDIITKLNNNNNPSKQEKITINHINAVTNDNIEDFCNNYLRYSEDSTKILYLQTIVEDYKKLTSSNVSNDFFAKELKKVLVKKYPNIEGKRYNNKKYYKGLYYINEINNV